jgi:hypothetical protein
MYRVLCVHTGQDFGTTNKDGSFASFSSQLFKDLFFINCWSFAKSFLENPGTTQNHHEVAEQSP